MKGQTSDPMNPPTAYRQAKSFSQVAGKVEQERKTSTVQSRIPQLRASFEDADASDKNSRGCGSKRKVIKPEARLEH